jgi:hypothetical protein
LRELHAIHGAGHFNIGKHQANIGACFQDADSFVGALSPNTLKPCALNKFQGTHQDKRAIFDDQDYRIAQ